MTRLSTALARLPLILRVGLAVLIYVVAAHVTAHDALAGVTTAMIFVPWSPPMVRSDLQAISDPVSAGQPEVVPWQLYDTQSIATASQAPLVFYQTINSDKTMSNMEGPGQLPDPQYLIVQYAACDILQVPKATALAGEPNEAAANIENLLKTVRATFEFNMSNKRYGPFSLTMTAATGGVTGAGYGYGTAASGTSMFAGNNGIPGSGGFPFGGALVIPPKIGFDVTIRFGANTTLINGPLNVRFSLVGALYRRVL